jgi:hypothetical protein
VLHEVAVDAFQLGEVEARRRFADALEAEQLDQLPG